MARRARVIIGVNCLIRRESVSIFGIKPRKGGRAAMERKISDK